MKSIRNKKILFLLLTVFLTSTITEGPYDFSCDLHKVVVIGNITHSTYNYAENSPRIKHNSLELALNYQFFRDNPLISNYPYIYTESWNPRDIYLPTKSDRAPPETIFS